MFLSGVLVKNCSLVYYQKQKSLLKIGKYGSFFTGAFMLWFQDSALQTETKDLIAGTLTPIQILETKLLDNPEDIKSRIELLFLKAQTALCKSLETEDGCDEFRVEKWSTPEGAGWISCMLQEGKVFEKATINVSIYNGAPPKNILQFLPINRQPREDSGGRCFMASIGCEVHPKNPMVPSLHFTYRYVELEDDGNKIDWWFKGGCDLTPFYYNLADAIHFHTTLKEACEKYDKTCYPKFKKDCDNYYYLRHRNEHRGVGGILYDNLDTPDAEACFNLTENLVNSMATAYIPLVQRHKRAVCTKDEKKWQLLRRSRYIEFTLLYDKDIRFDLNLPGVKPKWILAALPLQAQWEYETEPSPNSPEGEILGVLKNPKAWVEDCSCAENQEQNP